MDVSLILKKFNYDGTEGFEITLMNSWDLSDYLMGDVVITRQLESDAVFNFAVSFTSLTVSGNDTLTQEFTKENLTTYLYGIELSGNGTRRFVGQIDQTSVIYNSDFEQWEFKAKDWYKFYYDTLARQSWNFSSSGLNAFLTDNFYLSPWDFLHFGTVDVSQPGHLHNWDNSDANIQVLISEKLLSRTEYLGEVIKHYGAFLYVDANYNLNFINRARQTPPIYAHSINDLILDQTTTKTYVRESSYDGLLISQKTYLGGGSYEVSWKLLRYVQGVLDVTTILDESELNDIKGLRVLDIRQKLGAIPSGGTYTWGYRTGFRLFPQREFEETLKDYRDIFEDTIILGTEITYLEDLNLMSHIFYNDPYAQEYQIEYMEEDLVNEKMLIRAKEYRSSNIIP